MATVNKYYFKSLSKQQKGFSSDSTEIKWNAWVFFYENMQTKVWWKNIFTFTTFFRSFLHFYVTWFLRLGMSKILHCVYVIYTSIQVKTWIPSRPLTSYVFKTVPRQRLVIICVCTVCTVVQQDIWKKNRISESWTNIFDLFWG